jgi:hypothetical protein
MSNVAQFGPGIGRDSSTESMVKKSMSVAMRPRLTAKDTEDFAEVAEKNILCAPLRKPLRPLRLAFVLLSLTLLMACQAASSRGSLAISAGNLAEEYERSSAAVRGKYDGKEIIVSGYAMFAAKLPQSGDDQGSVLLEEKVRNTSRQVACWFSRDQAGQFSKIKGGQYITVRGIFNGEAGVDLKFCKLVKISPN